MIPDFKLILKISKIHRNFVAAEEIKSNLQNLDLDLGRLNNMLRQDESDGTFHFSLSTPVDKNRGLS